MMSKWHEMRPGDAIPSFARAWNVEERRALLRLMVELWDRADELERRGSSRVSRAANDGVA
jgi:hypothetical protein